MHIAVLSDTHGHVPCAQAALRVMRELDLEAVIHCGDIGSADVVRLFDDWPSHFVFGNVDSDREQLRAVIESAGQTCHGRFGELELAGRRIAFLHGDDARRLQETIASGEWDLVCYGHTHAAETHLEGHTTVLNPGALYRASPHSFALVELPEVKVSHVEV